MATLDTLQRQNSNVHELLWHNNSLYKQNTQAGAFCKIWDHHRETKDNYKESIWIDSLWCHSLEQMFCDTVGPR